MSDLRACVDSLGDAVIVIQDHRPVGYFDGDRAIAANVVFETVVEMRQEQPREIIERFMQRGIASRLLAPIKGKGDRLVETDAIAVGVEGENGVDLAAAALAVILDGDGGDAAGAERSKDGALGKGDAGYESASLPRGERGVWRRNAARMRSAASSTLVAPSRCSSRVARTSARSGLYRRMCVAGFSVMRAPPVRAANARAGSCGSRS